MAECVLTLIAAARASGELPGAAAAAGAALAALGARVARPDWLAPAIACDIHFDELDPDQADAAARAALAPGVAIDVVAQPAEGRRKRLLVADMEATIIENEMLDELAALKGVAPQIAAITARAMNGEIDFVVAMEERIAVLRGMPAAMLDEAASRIRISPGAASLVATMRENGAYAALVSGGLDIFARRVRSALGFDAAITNTAIVAEGRLAGVQQPILGKDAKLAALKRLAAERGLGLGGTLAVGDGANDLPMIEAAGLGIAYRGKPAVAARARARIDHADLTALLYAQGYRQAEIVAR